jgi:hypothetical protein
MGAEIMPATIDQPDTVTQKFQRAVLTGSDDRSTMTRPRNFREGWQRVVDKLDDWLRNPAQLEDEGIDQPTGRIVRIALDIAEQYREADVFAPPDRVIPDPNGGIVFETEDGALLYVVQIWDDASVEYMKFDGTHLVQREPLCIDS